MVRRIAFVAVLAALALAGALTSLGTARKALPTVSTAFEISIVAHVPEARELVIAPNGDLFVGTLRDEVAFIADPESAHPEAKTFVHIDDAPVAGVTLGDGALFAGGQFGIWRIPYASGDRAAHAEPKRIAQVRTSGRSSDHHTTTLAFAGGRLYASVGSSCDACRPELDDTRATIQEMQPDGTALRVRVVGIRNAIALAVDPATGEVWAGVAGQDALERGHPYEIFDPFTTHAGVPDYGWPYCYENRRATSADHDCSNATIPRVVFPAYATPIGAAFYPAGQHGRYSFGGAYAGGAFVTLHGSWHVPPVAPRVAFVPLKGDVPATPVNWSDPAAQWREFVGGFAVDSGPRIGRPTGVAVGAEGSLFVADDKAGVIYRIRPRGR